MLGSNDDEDGGDWNEEDEGTKDFSGVEGGLMDGDNAGSKWLVVDGIHILHKKMEYTNGPSSLID